MSVNMNERYGHHDDRKSINNQPKRREESDINQRDHLQESITLSLEISRFTKTMKCLSQPVTITIKMINS